MASTHSAAEEPTTTFTVLVTGANSGLGFALCCRLIDDFLHTRPLSHSLHILFSTRDGRKRDDTLRRLHAHLRRASPVPVPRVRVEGVLVDLLRLSSVRTLAQQLLRRRQPLDAVVWNAGIAGWTGVDWLRAVRDVLADPLQATTYPRYMKPDVGLLAPTQLDGADAAAFTEPVLGQVFTANVFGHYLLTHWLAPLMHADTRVIWTSSVSATAETFAVEDVQGLRAWQSYESSKRLTDFLVLTSELPATSPYVRGFLPAGVVGASEASSSSSSPRPRMYVVHPGVVATSISGLHWFLAFFMMLTFYVDRWLGSPWHLVTPYKGAVSAAFAVLAPQLAEQEESEGKGKWASAIGVSGHERVARTEVEGWGYCGRVGVVPPGSVTAGLFRDRQITDEERRREFEETGRLVWKEMEAMRREWERLLGPIDAEGEEAAA